MTIDLCAKAQLNAHVAQRKANLHRKTITKVLNICPQRSEKDVLVKAMIHEVDGKT